MKVQSPNIEQWLMRHRDSIIIRQLPSGSIEIVEAPQPQPIETMECGICCEPFPYEEFCLLANCLHSYCTACVKKHIMYCVTENRIDIPCPGCGTHVHPDDVRLYCNEDPEFIAKYERFSVRSALIKDPSARWCPAPDCGFAVIVPNGKKCPKIRCQRPECGIHFCFTCKKPWHEGSPCLSENNVFRTRTELVPCRPCPRCKTLILKEDDGSCNHMTCTLCKAEFCWLCLKQITDFHYMTPSGCTFWGRRPWSGRKRLMWQIGSLIGSPAVIVATAVVSVPLIVGMVPYSVGKKVYKKMGGSSKAKRVISTAAAVTGSAIISPAIAGVAVGLGVPFAFGYTYLMVPKTMINDAVEYVRKKKHQEGVAYVGGVSDESTTGFIVEVPRN
uniref:RBR-type E3 ubiquitin transferase n=1 Tax=Caenorhabditis tropicalis TaxID=1561998 RepID=A0A1I7UKN9_9PELO